MKTIIDLGSGPTSDFGGPKDTGVLPDETLALIGISDLTDWWFRRLFLMPGQWDNSKGLARNLNPDALYIAMRFAYGSFAGKQGNILQGFTREQVRRGIFFLEANGKLAIAQAADWGPGWDAPEGNRLVDSSPGVLSMLGVSTDAIVGVSFLPPD